MTKEEITSKFLPVLAEHLGMDPANIQLNHTLGTDLKCDSLDGIEIIMAAEETFGIELADNEVSINMTVLAVVTLIETRLAEP